MKTLILIAFLFQADSTDTNQVVQQDTAKQFIIELRELEAKTDSLLLKIKQRKK